MVIRIDREYEELSFPSDVDGVHIFYRQWSPPVSITPRAIVQITHGICEHGGRYDRFARYLSGRGYVVVAPDLRGHGQTAGITGLGQAGLTAWADMTSDIVQLSRLAKSRHRDLPLIAFGHSMGSALTQAQIQTHGNLLAGAVLCGTLGALPPVVTDDTLATLEIAAHSAEGNRPSALMGDVLQALNAPFVQADHPTTGCEWMTADQTEIQRFLGDALCGKPFSNSMLYSVLDGFRKLWILENESRIPVDLPILIVAGTRDPVGANTASIQTLIARYMRQGHLALAYRFYPGDRHEILNERSKERVHRDIDAWCDGILERL
ncbi:lysophospholipase [Burkholderia metallica]|uniref:alpha/beta fold hydrolase n=1 Tax=Burkholderia metallica TaxID=488729 RepID=UPI00157B053D|nr:alpha/beta fold hydrolase [Burkholderia metallica]NTZ87283.1 lysophospholipase [Burkholderia metallica]